MHVYVYKNSTSPQIYVYWYVKLLAIINNILLPHNIMIIVIMLNFHLHLIAYRILYDICSDSNHDMWHEKSLIQAHILMHIKSHFEHKAFLTGHKTISLGYTSICLDDNS